MSDKHTDAQGNFKKFDLTKDVPVTYGNSTGRATEGQAQTSAAVDIGCLKEQADAWMAVFDVLGTVAPGWADGPHRTGMENAVHAIENLAAQLADSTAPGAPELVTAGALRQFKHNDGSNDFVMGYDKAIVDREFAHLAARFSPGDDPASHPDDLAVQAFADAMKAKMAKSRAKGRGGWQECHAEDLRRMMSNHFAKGDPVDVGNFAMMLWNRGESTAAPTAQQSLTDGGAVPIPMILFCPKCGKQHIDAPDARKLPAFGPGMDVEPWTNPPHRSHLCHGCGNIWRPADVATEGVAALKTAGSNDSVAAPTAQQSLTAGGAVPDERAAFESAYLAEFGNPENVVHDGVKLAWHSSAGVMWRAARRAAAPLPQVQSEAIPDLYIGKWSFSTDEENFSGELDSEQDAIAEATAQGYEKFWVGQCVHPVETLPDAQSIGEIFIEQAEEWASEECGGDDRIFELNDDDTTKLGQMVRDFIKREASVQRYGVTNITLHQPEPDQQPVTPSGALADNDGGVK